MNFYVIFGAVLVAFVVYQVLWTYLHGRTLDRHNKEMRKLYEKYR